MKFLKAGEQVVTIGPDRPLDLNVVNPSSHRFKCTHYTQGLRIVVTPPNGIDVAIQAHPEGRKPRPPIDRRGPGKVEKYAGHPALGGTVFHVTATGGTGDVTVRWAWYDTRCRGKDRSDG